MVFLDNWTLEVLYSLVGSIGIAVLFQAQQVSWDLEEASRIKTGDLGLEFQSLEFLTLWLSTKLFGLSIIFLNCG